MTARCALKALLQAEIRRRTPPLTAADGEQAREYLDVALSVVKVADDAPVPEVDGTLPAVPADAARLKDLGERWGLGSSLSRFVTAVSQA